MASLYEYFVKDGSDNLTMHKTVPISRPDGPVQVEVIANVILIRQFGVYLHWQNHGQFRHSSVRKISDESDTESLNYFDKQIYQIHLN